MQNHQLQQVDKELASLKPYADNLFDAKTDCEHQILIILLSEVTDYFRFWKNKILQL